MIADLRRLTAYSDDEMGDVPKDAGALRPTRLRCEYHADPLGINTASPRLSWIVESGQQGQAQTVYRLLVATNDKKLTAGLFQPR